MRNLTGIRAGLTLLFLIIGIGGVLLSRHAAAATLCSGLPPSNLASSASGPKPLME
jgi:hypothetical protein